MLVGIYELERNVVQAFESLYPHIPGGIIRSPVVAKPHEPLGYRCNNDYCAQTRHDGDEPLEIYVPFSQDKVDSLSDQNGGVKRGCHMHDRQCQRQAQVNDIWPCESKDALDNAAVVPAQSVLTPSFGSCDRQISL